MPPAQGRGSSQDARRPDCREGRGPAQAQLGVDPEHGPTADYSEDWLQSWTERGRQGHGDQHRAKTPQVTPVPHTA